MSPDANLNADLAGRTPDLIGVLRRQWPIIVACTLIAGVLSYLYVSSSEVTYESKSTILLEALPGEIAPGGGRERTLDVETQATVARSTELLQTVADRLGLTANDVKNASRVEAAPTGDVLYVFYGDDEAEFAAEGALVYSEEFLAHRKASADDAANRQKALIQAQIDSLNAEVADLTEQIDELIAAGDDASTLGTVLQTRQNLAIRDLSTANEQLANIDSDQNPGSVVVDPRTAVNRTGLRKPFVIAGGMVVGLLIGVILGLLRDRRDDRYGSALGLESVGVQEVGRLRFPGAPRPDGQRDYSQRDYARLLVRLGFSNGVMDNGHRAVMILAVESITLPEQSMRAVAEALAARGPDNGLVTTVMSPERGADDSSPSYWQQFGANLAGQRRDNDIVLVAAGAFDRSVAGLAVASKVDQTILLVSESTKVSDLVRVIEDLESVDAREIGVVVLTRVPPRRKW